jgi:hypothetical protein
MGRGGMDGGGCLDHGATTGSSIVPGVGYWLGLSPTHPDRAN